MENNPPKSPPDEKQIEALLRSFKAHPTARFSIRMKQAPWQINSSRAPISSPHPIKSTTKLIWIMGILLLVVLLFGVSFIPSIQAVARQIFFHFIPAPSDQLKIQITLSQPGDLLLFSEASNFPLSIAEAQQLAGFETKEIGRLPEGLTLIGSRYERGYVAVIILYQAEDYRLFLTQRPLGRGQDVFSIGSSAQVKLVAIGDAQGELVQGGWQAISTPISPKNVSSDKPLSIEAVWVDSLPQYTLRWQSDGYIYEIRTIGIGSPSESDLITMANELK